MKGKKKKSRLGEIYVSKKFGIQQTMYYRENKEETQAHVTFSSISFTFLSLVTKSQTHTHKHTHTNTHTHLIKTHTHTHTHTHTQTQTHTRWRGVSILSHLPSITFLIRSTSKSGARLFSVWLLFFCL